MFINWVLHKNQVAVVSNFFRNMLQRVSHLTIYELVNMSKKGIVALFDMCFPSVVPKKNVTKTFVSDIGTSKGGTIVSKHGQVWRHYFLWYSILCTLNHFSVRCTGVKYWFLTKLFFFNAHTTLYVSVKLY